jgi:hypothetical protein
MAQADTIVSTAKGATMLNARALADLKWFFTTAAGEIGLRSNFQAMVSQLSAFGTRSGGAVQVDERKLQAAERARAIQSRFAQCSSDAQNVLQLACSELDDDASVMAVVQRDPRAAAEWQKSGTNRDLGDWLSRLRESTKTADYERARVWLRLKADALRRVEVALREYSER